MEFRHAAAGPNLTVVLIKGEGAVAKEVDRGGVAAGVEYGPIITTEGEHTVRILKGDEILAQTTGFFKNGHAYWIYATGSIFRNTTTMLSIESVPDAIPGFSTASRE